MAELKTATTEKSKTVTTGRRVFIAHSGKEASAPALSELRGLLRKNGLLGENASSADASDVNILFWDETFSDNCTGSAVFKDTCAAYFRAGVFTVTTGEGSLPVPPPFNLCVYRLPRDEKLLIRDISDSYKNSFN